jgi:tRNA nucleotidyltransferase/poly(A) polymerase
MWSTIPESIKILHTLFKEHNKSLFVVGGSVRDFLNKETPKDFDLATDATPEEVLTITKGYKTKLQGEAFGVVVVYTKDGEFEVATFRTDLYESMDEFLNFLKNKDINKYNLFLEKLK